MQPELLNKEQIYELVSARNHSLHISRHRAQIISERVRGISWLFALLTPLWILVDAWVFPWPIWVYLGMMRLMCSAAFFGLMQIKNERRSLHTAFLMLGTMLAIPPMFYLASQPLLVGMEQAGASAHIAAHLYGLLPFIVLAGLSVFPLTVAETLTAAVAIIVVVATSTAYHAMPEMVDILTTMWMLMLVTGVSTLSGMSQLHYIITLVNQASMDVLTGAFTRRSGKETIDLQFRLSARTNTHLTVMFLDIDNFKSVNDIHGHDAGDRVLYQVAQSLSNCLRKSDILIRWGGEEFLILLADNAAEGASHVLQRISEHGLGKRPDGQPVTVSIGVAERVTDNSGDWDNLIELADNRMYQSKTAGKNRSTGYGKSTTISPLIKA